MAFSILYKKLFEVWILHPFFLDQGNKKKFYDFDAESRAKALKGYDISEDFGVVPTPETRKLLANYKMRLLPAAHGFTVAVKVTPSSSGGNKVFIPAIPLEEGLKLRFRIRIRRPGLPLWRWRAPP